MFYELNENELIFGLVYCQKAASNHENKLETNKIVRKYYDSMHKKAKISN